MDDRQLIADLLSALEYHTEQTRPIQFSKVAIQAAREHLRKPAQQEPVAWMYPDDYERMSTSETFCTVYSVEVGSATGGESTVALYTSPPAQRTWVGLTNDEVNNLAAGCHLGNSVQDAIYKAVAKLKEKNT